MKKIILITGASSGMGKETAKELIKDGHTVYCAARYVEKMKDLEAAGGKVLKMDVSDRATIEDGVNQIIQDQGRIDVLWNNAGLGEIKLGMEHRDIPPIGVSHNQVDYAKLADAFGCRYEQPDSLGAFASSIERSLNERVPTLIEVLENSDWLS